MQNENIMGVLNLLHSFNQEQEKQNQLIKNKFRDVKKQQLEMMESFDRRNEQMKIYASYDEICEKVTKVQNQVMEQRR